MGMLFSNSGMAFIVLLTLVAAFIFFIPTYQEWKSKRLAEKLRVRLIQEKHEQILKSRSPASICQPQIKLSTAA